MKICLHVGLNAEAPRGTDVFTDGLVRALAEADPGNTLTLFSYFFKDFELKRRRLPGAGQANVLFDVRQWPESAIHALEQRLEYPVIDTLLDTSRFDVFHGVVGWLPRQLRARSVVTAYDLHRDVEAERAKAEGRAPMTAAPVPTVGESLRRADRVIAVSRATQRDVTRFYNVDPARVAVVYPGVNHERFQLQDTAAMNRVREKHRLPERYLMFLGPFEPKRNEEASLEAVAKLRREGPHANCELLFVGARNDYYARLEERADRLGLLKDMRCTGYAAPEDLPALYQGALAFVRPILHEGFGLPVLEAMACGAPVIASNVSGVPEAVGDAGLLIDPAKPDELARALGRVLQDAGFRDSLRQKGLARARQFSWKRAAEETLAVYREATADTARDYPRSSL